MWRAVDLRFPPAFFAFLAISACLFCAVGCNNTCVSGVLNSPSGSNVNVAVGSPPPSCPLSTANGIVHIEIDAPAGANSVLGSERPHFTHLFITLAGVDVHPSALADDNSPDWKPIAAELQEHPRQVDLLADAQTSNSTAPFPDAILPAGLYGQMRMRLAVAPANGQFWETNHCGGQTLHCAITSDGRVLPLRFLESAPNIRIRPDNTDGQRLYVPPGSSTALKIEFDANRSFLLPLGDSFLVAPVFHLNVQRPDRAHEF